MTLSWNCSHAEAQRLLGIFRGACNLVSVRMMSMLRPAKIRTLGAGLVHIWPDVVATVGSDLARLRPRLTKRVQHRTKTLSTPASLSTLSQSSLARTLPQQPNLVQFWPAWVGLWCIMHRQAHIYTELTEFTSSFWTFICGGFCVPCATGDVGCVQAGS